jgi:hypothetical protein
MTKVRFSDVAHFPSFSTVSAISGRSCASKKHAKLHNRCALVCKGGEMEMNYPVGTDRTSSIAAKRNAVVRPNRISPFIASMAPRSLPGKKACASENPKPIHLRGRRGTHAMGTAIMPVTNIPSKVPASAIERTGSFTESGNGMSLKDQGIARSHFEPAHNL